MGEGFGDGGKEPLLKLSGQGGEGPGTARSFPGGGKQPCWLRVLTLNPFPCATSSFRAPGAQQPGLAQRGRWEAAFNSISAWEKFPFMWLPVISPGGSADGGVQRGAEGGAAEGEPSPPAQGKLQHLRTLKGWRGSSWRGEGKESLASRGHQAGGPCMPPPGCWQHKSCRWPRPALRCGVDDSCASPKGEGGAVTQPVCTA